MTDSSRAEARRAFISANHPDRGGDPGVFAAGLAAYDQPAGTSTTATDCLSFYRRPRGLRRVTAALTRRRHPRTTRVT